MHELIAFLNARYDEAEAKARAVQNRFPGPWNHADNTDSSLPGAVTLYDSRDESVGVIRGSYAAAYIAGVDPAHRLADIALKRAILALHRPEPPPKYGTDIPRCATCLTGRGGWKEDWNANPWPCATVRQLGTEFGQHPEYKAGWAP